MRIEQPEGQRGSLKWIQRLVEKQPTRINEQLQMITALEAGNHLTWLSPLREDSWAEYRDSLFLRRIGQDHLSEALAQFWPRRGPQWDALAKDESGRVFLFEAKAHGSEMSSNCQAEKKSRTIINRSMVSAKQVLDAKADSNWLNGYYQYANRLAHLNFLHQHGVDAWLVFLYFTGDQEMNGPLSEDEWMPLIEAVHLHLGLSQRLRGVATIFQTVEGL